jgi:hypothetical protein
MRRFVRNLYRELIYFCLAWEHGRAQEQTYQNQEEIEEAVVELDYSFTEVKFTEKHTSLGYMRSFFKFN